MAATGYIGSDPTKVDVAGGTMTGTLSIGGETSANPYNLTVTPQGGPAVQINLIGSFDGGEDEGEVGQFDSTARLNFFGYQRADTHPYGETIRHYLMRSDAKMMEAYYAPQGLYDPVTREAVGTRFVPVVWTGAHYEANNHASIHGHWEIEIPDSTGALQGRFEVKFVDADGNIGVDKTNILTNLTDFSVRCSNGQVLRLGANDTHEKAIEWSLSPDGETEWRRWKLRATASGADFQLARYDDAGTFLDSPVSVSRSTGNVTLGPGVIARRATASVSSLSLNSTSLGGGVGVFALGNANTAPPNAPTGGGVLYASGGALLWRGSSGTITTIAPA